MSMKRKKLHGRLEEIIKSNFIQSNMAHLSQGTDVPLCPVLLLREDHPLAHAQQNYLDESLNFD